MMQPTLPLLFVQTTHTRALDYSSIVGSQKPLRGLGSMKNKLMSIKPRVAALIDHRVSPSLLPKLALNTSNSRDYRDVAPRPAFQARSFRVRYYSRTRGTGTENTRPKSLSPKSSGSDPQAMLLSHNGHFLTGDLPRVCRDENLPSLAQLEHPIIMVLEQCHYIRRSLSGGC